MKSYLLRTPFWVELPTIWTEEDGLYIKSSSFQYVMGLFSECRMVHVNTAGKIVAIKDKKRWRWERPLTIPFDNIDHIDLIASDVSRPDIKYHSDVFDLFLVAQNPSRKILLFKFGRLGTAGSIYHATAKGCADLIVKFTDTRLGLYNPDEQPLADFNDAYICQSCGHRLPPSSEFTVCSYCGGREIRIV